MVVPGNRGKIPSVGTYEVLEIGQGTRSGFVQVRWLDGENRGIERWRQIDFVRTEIAASQRLPDRGPESSDRLVEPRQSPPRSRAGAGGNHARRGAETIAQEIDSYSELMQRARFAREKEEYEAAEVYFLRAGQLSAGQNGWRVGLAAIYRKQGRHKELDRLVDPVLLAWRNTAALNVKAASLGDRGRFEEAYSFAREAVQQAGDRDRDRSFALRTLGRAAFNVGNLEEAEWCFGQAGDTSTDWYNLLEQLVIEYRSRGDEAGAARVRRLIARYWPRSPS